MHGDTGTLERVVSIWEIKAPQAALMEPDENQNRYRPTKELYKAENQLIHYWYQARGDSLFKQRFQLHNESQVKLGGVVIGRNDTITRNSDPSKVRAARLSLDIRMNTLYQHNGLKVLVWDRLLTFVAPRSSPAAGSAPAITAAKVTASPMS